jgi:hypothetical protein
LAFRLRLDEVDPELTMYAEGGAEAHGGARAVTGFEARTGSRPRRRATSSTSSRSIPRDAVEVWSEWRGGARPSLEDAVRAVTYSARNDAFLPA